MPASPAMHFFERHWGACVCCPAEDVLEWLHKCAAALRPGGLVILKENICASGFVVDEDDSSLTRSDAYLLVCAAFINKTWYADGALVSTSAVSARQAQTTELAQDWCLRLRLLCCKCRLDDVATWHAGPDHAIGNDPGVQPTAAQLSSRPLQGPDVCFEAALTPQYVMTALRINGSVRGLVSTPGCIGGRGRAGNNSSACSRSAAHTVQGVRNDHAVENVCASVGCTTSAMPVFAVSCMV